MVEETSLLALLITLIHFSVLLSFNAKLVRIRASLLAQLVKNPPTMQETWFDSWVGMIHWRRDRLPTPVFLGFPGGSAGIESACSVGDLDSVPVLGRSPGEGNSHHFRILAWRIPRLYSPWGHKESDMIEQLSLSLCIKISSIVGKLILHIKGFSRKYAI